MSDAGISVVFDINVYLDYILGDDGSWPLLPDVPPATGNAAADAVALAFTARFRLFSSPHILRNIVRVMRAVGQKEAIIEGFAAAIVDICEFSGGAVIEPEARDHGVRDYEDNLIISLAADPAVDAAIIVTRDHHLLDLGPAFHGRLILPPEDFVHHILFR